MKRDEMKRRTCPRCGQEFADPPALSRVDNETLLCPDCGVREALESIGVSWQEQNQILRTIHEHRQAPRLRAIESQNFD